MAWTMQHRCLPSVLTLVCVAALTLAGCNQQSQPTTDSPVAPTAAVEPVSPAPTPPPTVVPGPAVATEAILVGAGDIAECGYPGAEETAKLLDGIAGTVFTAGDNAYMNGTPREFECYHRTWGRHKNRTYPTPGNHDYGTPNAAGYFGYFGERAGPPGQGYYSFTAGAWHVQSLNSTANTAENQIQMQWMRRDLQQAQARCLAAIVHHPLVSSGPNGDNPWMRDVWRVLSEFGADLVIAGHDHLYERHGRMNSDGRPDPRGPRLITAGTGGARLYHSSGQRPTTEARIVELGVLKLVLQPGSYRWEFHGTNGILDSGSDVCD